MSTKRTVLVVEDHPPTRQRLEEYIASVGARVHAVANAALALDYLKTQRVDLVVTDFIMPHVDGIKLVGQLRAKPQWAGSPVILLTAVNTEETARAADAVGVKVFLAKPFTKQQLVLKMEQAVHVAADPAGRRPTVEEWASFVESGEVDEFLK